MLKMNFQSHGLISMYHSMADVVVSACQATSSSTATAANLHVLPMCTYVHPGVAQERTALRSRVDALTAELAGAREGAADLRLRLEHITGPAGPQARAKQLEASLQLVSIDRVSGWWVAWGRPGRPARAVSCGMSLICISS
jgi:hypothetical protein